MEQRIKNKLFITVNQKSVSYISKVHRIILCPSLFYSCLWKILHFLIPIVFYFVIVFFVWVQISTGGGVLTVISTCVRWYFSGLLWLTLQKSNFKIYTWIYGLLVKIEFGICWAIFKRVMDPEFRKFRGFLQFSGLSFAISICSYWIQNLFLNLHQLVTKKVEIGPR